MDLLNLSRGGVVNYALAITTGTALLAGCSSNSGSSLGPSGASASLTGIGHVGRAVTLNGLLVTAAHPNVRMRRNSQISICPEYKRQPDQYVSDYEDSAVLQFDYPNCILPIGSITGVLNPQGECARNGKRTFWVTASGSAQIDEFKVGGTMPLKQLSESAGEPSSCAIDSATGNLAATIVSNGDVVLYKNAGGSGAVVTTPLIEAYFDGYDNRGNLFVDGFNRSDAFGLVELKKGSRAFETLATSNTVGFPGGVQWDGKYVTVNDQDGHAIYRYRVSGTKARLENAVALSGSYDCVQTSITTTFVYCPDAGNDDVEVYKYPAGGSPVAFLGSNAFNLPVGAVKLVK